MRFNLSDRYSLPSLKFLITILQIFMRIIRHFSRIATVLAKYPLKMQLDSPEFHALFTPELKKLSSIFTSNGFELRMAGGAVRDLLMGVRPSDVDFATDATPLQMKEIFTQEQIRMLNKNGEEHGTITCRIDDKENFEITTLRIDVVCDGRRAAVKFTKDWEEDAFRRDLTINSLFLDLDGFVHDYTGGIEDIKNRRISFVGDPVIRLQEDFLRILRYFRFFGRFAPVGATHEPKNIEAIIKCKDGLKNISGERLWMEFNKILIGRMASSVIKEMLLTCKLGPFLCLPENVGFDEFERVAKVNSPKGEDGPLAAAPSTLLSALFNKIEDVERFQSRCKCSNAEKWLCELIVQKREEAMKHKNDINYFKYAILDEIFERGG
ncbi:unnamed protein product [Meloidogyne enterolobii]|uniref:Uncharacterized protein n=1 Tax=Meloidogyne enterolobii TaxID=390850 RepID=A0ACB0Y0G6_MELEN